MKELADSLTRLLGDNVKIDILVVHEKHDGTFECLPATLIEYDDNGYKKEAVEFTTNSLSYFAVAVRVAEVDLPKTLDDTLSYVGLIAVSLVTSALFGAYMRKERR